MGGFLQSGERALAICLARVGREEGMANAYDNLSLELRAGVAGQGHGFVCGSVAASCLCLLISVKTLPSPPIYIRDGGDIFILLILIHDGDNISIFSDDSWWRPPNYNETMANVVEKTPAPDLQIADSDCK
ncbi:hypothetical protein NE237_011800 [Protea cynaroides]|uniref:Uncharacterized protein n=1 Tax=Protea cynaroides TaxID=273540 RepID=A0A9Q0GZU5_9MAGN|nr:hypothetical protein NE237_011800 [Protea cynaroides]